MTAGFLSRGPVKKQSTHTEFIDAAEVVRDFREAVEQRNAATTPAAIDEYDRMAKSNCMKWPTAVDTMTRPAMRHGAIR